MTLGARLRRLWSPDLVLLALSATALVLVAAYYATGHGLLDAWDHARGRDFVNVWTAGQLVGEGRALEVFDPARFWPAEHRLFDPHLPFHFWSYPPPALLLTLPFVGWPYALALVAWTLGGLALLAPAARVFLRSAPGARWGDLWLLLLAPAVAVNVALGQNGAISAALLLGGLALRETRPLVGGALLGLLIFKPQVALLLPVLALAEGRWRLIAAAAASAVALLALSTALFGLDAWRAFFAHTLPMQAQMLRHGSGPFLWMMPSAFASARLWRLDAVAAMAVQAPFLLFGASAVWIAGRSGAADRVRAAVLALATAVASPQVFNYDLIPVAAASLVLWRLEPLAGWRPSWSWTGRALVVLTWALPAAMMPLHHWRWTLAPAVLALTLLRLLIAGRALQPAPRPQRETAAASASAAGEAVSNT